jgi:hypothetical protein
MCANNKIKIDCTEEQGKAIVTCKDSYTVLKDENLYHNDILPDPEGRSILYKSNLN